jgi:hypothetical protein
VDAGRKRSVFRQQTHAGETQATLEAARLDSIQGIGFFPLMFASRSITIM